MASNQAPSAVRPVDPVERMPTGWRWAYELTMAALAITVVVLLALPTGDRLRTVDLAIYVIFVIDYGARLALSGDRRRFVRTRIADLMPSSPPTSSAQRGSRDSLDSPG